MGNIPPAAAPSGQIFVARSLSIPASAGPEIPSTVVVGHLARCGRSSRLRRSNAFIIHSPQGWEWLSGQIFTQNNETGG